MDFTKFTIETFDAINDPTIKLQAWQQVDAELKRLKALEAHMRPTIVLAYFPTAGEGTTNFDLGGGWTLKAVKKNNYKLAKDEPDKGTTPLDDALTAVEKLGEKGKFLAERIVAFKPELSITEYKKLDAADPTDKAVKAIIDSVLTITDGMPSLEIVAPKAK